MTTAKKLLVVAKNLYQIGAKEEAQKLVFLAFEATDADQVFVAADAADSLDQQYQKEADEEDERAVDLIEDRTLENMLKNGDTPLDVGTRSGGNNFAVEQVILALVEDLEKHNYQDIAIRLKATTL